MACKHGEGEKEIRIEEEEPLEEIKVKSYQERNIIQNQVKMQFPRNSEGKENRFVHANC